MRLHKFLNHKYTVSGFLVLIVLLSFLSVNGFIYSVRQSESEKANNTLKSASDNGAEMIRSVFEGYTSQLRLLAKTAEKFENLQSEDFVEFLTQAAQVNDYERLALVLPNGESVTTDGLTFNIKESYNTFMLDEKESISDVFFSQKNGASVVSLSVPLYSQSGDFKGSLLLALRTSTINEALNLTLFDGKGYYHLVDQKGDYIADVTSKSALLMESNFFDAIEQLEYETGYSALQIRECFKRGNSVFSRYSSGENRRYAYCSPVGINNWVLMTIVPKDIISHTEQYNIRLAVNMTIQLGLILSAMFFYIYFLQRKSRKMAELNDKCFRALSEQTGKIILEWDFVKNRLTSSKSFVEKFGREAATRTGQHDALDSKMVHPDDAGAFTDVFTDLFRGISFENIRFRVMHSDGTYHWCVLAGVVVTDWRGKPYRAIGTLEDINETVLRQERLKYKSETDLLTALYNKATTEHMIKEALSNKNAGNCALLLADIDNFKSVNDLLGHQHGDLILKRFADMAVPLVRKTDIIGRIGGDEFFIFFRDFEDYNLIRRKAEELCRKFKASLTESENNCNLSLSIGISLFPRDAQDFDEMYKQADIALYRTKRSGKNGYIIYNSSFGNDVSNTRTAIESSNEQR